MDAAYGWLMKDKLIDESNFAHWGYELTEKYFFLLTQQINV